MRLMEKTAGHPTKRPNTSDNAANIHTTQAKTGSKAPVVNVRHPLGTQGHPPQGYSTLSTFGQSFFGCSFLFSSGLSPCVRLRPAFVWTAAHKNDLDITSLSCHSVMCLLHEEVPQFTLFWRAKLKVKHECKSMDTNHAQVHSTRYVHAQQHFTQGDSYSFSV